METPFYNAIWDMLASGMNTEEIKNGFEMIDFNKLVDEVSEAFEEN